MNDLEMIKLCSKAMEIDAAQDFPTGALWIKKTKVSAHRDEYDPLHDDAQAMEMVKRLQLQVGWHSDTGEEEGNWYASESTSNWAYSKESLNRAICACVA